MSSCKSCREDGIDPRLMSLVPGDDICFPCAKHYLICFSCGASNVELKYGMCLDCYAEYPERCGKCNLCGTRGRCNSKYDGVCSLCGAGFGGKRRGRRVEEREPVVATTQKKTNTKKNTVRKIAVTRKQEPEKGKGKGKGKKVVSGAAKVTGQRPKKVVSGAAKGKNAKEEEREKREEDKENSTNTSEEYPYSTKTITAALSQKRQAQLAQDKNDYFTLIRKDRKKVDVKKYSTPELLELADKWREDRQKTSQLCYAFLHPHRYTEEDWKKEVDQKPLDSDVGVGVDDWRMAHELMVVVYLELSERFVWSLFLCFFVSLFLCFFHYLTLFLIYTLLD